jgi:acylphosphatase
MTRVRRRAYYSGRVQGVGFRFVSRSLAQRFAVAGYVRNLDDGRVELVADGDPPEVSAFLDAILRELGDKIRDVRVESESPDDPPLSDFIIRY